MLASRGDGTKKHAENLEFESVSGCGRWRKSPAEVEAMRQSAQLAAAGMRRCMQRTHPGVFEFQLAADFGEGHLRLVVSVLQGVTSRLFLQSSQRLAVN